MRPVRLGAVNYLNARPLVEGLDRRQDLFDLRFDPPSRCAELLHDHAIDVGMIPSIEYCRGPEYAVVPGMGIVSDGPVASVALFARRPVCELERIAADTSSRTSQALLRILCSERFGITPEFVQMPPDAASMLRECDAALLIGDPALYLDPREWSVTKTDLGEEWTAMTGLPFVWAFWAGRPGALGGDAVDALATARDAGVAAADRLAAEYCGAARADQCAKYLRENIRYTLTDHDVAGVAKYYELAERCGLIERRRSLQFYAKS